MSHDRNQIASDERRASGYDGDGFGEWATLQSAGTHRQGVASGQLTPGETKNLESREAGVNSEIHNDRAANGGTLTPQERQQVNHQQNNLSKSIYNDKHNAATDHYGNNEVGARRDNQQQRIANGIRSGQMSPSEAARSRGARAEYQPPGRSGPPGEWRKAHIGGKEEHQQETE